MAKGKIYIDTEVCKACGLCVPVCPKKILEIDKQSINKRGYTPIKTINPDECTGCALCAIMCPDSVIEVERFDGGKK